MPDPYLNLDSLLDQAAREKGLPKRLLVSALEEAIRRAALKHFGEERHLESRYDPTRGTVDLFQALTVVDQAQDPERAINEISLEDARRLGLEVQAGDELVLQVFYREEDEADAKLQDEQFHDLLKLTTHRHGFGRIAAHTVRSVLLERTRSAERERTFLEYQQRTGEIVAGTVLRFERGNYLVDLGDTEAVLPYHQQLPREVFRAGEQVRAIITQVIKEGSGPQVVLSRASNAFLEALFAEQVREIGEGTVEIRAVAREPGTRAKVAVTSNDPRIDPVGACVGPRGSRVQQVVRELGGERVDILEYDEDPIRLACAAIAPAEVTKVVVDQSAHSMELVMEEDQLPLAIGRKGQNVRLASKLTGWKLNVRGPQLYRPSPEPAPSHA